MDNFRKIIYLFFAKLPTFMSKSRRKKSLQYIMNEGLMDLK